MNLKIWENELKNMRKNYPDIFEDEKPKGKKTISEFETEKMPTESFAEYKAKKEAEGMMKIWNKYGNWREKKNVQEQKFQLDVSKKTMKEEETVHDQAIKRYTEVGEVIGGIMETAFSGQQNAGKAMLKESLKITLDFLEKKSLAAILGNEFDNIMKLGIFGLIKAAPEAALIAALFQTAKAGISAFAGGGYVRGRVGEQGPEDVYLPAGSYVNNAINNANTTNENSNVHLHFYGKGGKAIKEIEMGLRSGEAKYLMTLIKREING